MLISAKHNSVAAGFSEVRSSLSHSLLLGLQETFIRELYTLTSNWKYYEIYTGSGHYQRGRRRHYYSNYEFFGIHSDITHIDYVSQSLWGVKGQHAYRGPYYSHNKFLPRRESFYRTPDTEATNCNLKVSQFFGNRR
jgi:hypothetical protein